MKENKGSMTVEAVLLFLLMLCCFMFMLNVAKIAVLELEMQTIVSDVADRMAGDAFVIGKLNKWQDSMDEEQIKSTAVSGFVTTATESGTGLLNELINNKLFTDKHTSEGRKQAGLSMAKAEIGAVMDITKFLVNNLKNDLYGTFYPFIADRKNEIIHRLAEECAAKNVENAMLGFDKTNLQLDVVKMPQTTREYQSSAISLAYIAAGITPGVDFDKDDVVISMSYKYRIKLPFFGTHDIVLRKTAVEKAWLNGGDGIVNYPRSESKLLSMGINKLIEMGFGALTGENRVYVSGGSKNYHLKESCRKLEDENYVAIAKENAEHAGYKRCGVCG